MILSRQQRVPQFPHAYSVWRDHAWFWGAIVFLGMLTILLVVWLVEPAPPKTIVISAGPADGSFWPAANAYRKILARDGVTLKVLPSDGSLQNLHRLLDPKQHVDLALVQGGVAQGLDTSSLMSLGSVFYAPIVVLYRGGEIARLSQLNGKRIAIGREGSGTRVIALNLLKANGIVAGGAATLLPFDGQESARQLAAGKIDAAFFNGDSATRGLMLRLLQDPNVLALNFTQAAAYTRLFPYLNQIDLPAGVLDLGRNIPPATVHLISPMVELVARPNLHPAISDLLIEAAQEVHGMPGLLQRSGEFPSPIEHEYRISEDAARYYRSGKNFLYRNLPFWMASLVDRTLVLLIPMAVLFFPALRVLPALYRWRVRSRIYRWYGLLIAIEREALEHVTDEERDRLVKDLDHIDESVNQLKMPLAYADAFYVLREHVGFVRSRLSGEQRPA
ncbi:TAXI family TRAP transporter solute-binding subunit [Silvimonas sp.]|uniref:TAXI family TRAP transporter solute-binding subunit n=1 Tax=Silvimonas sp. TaxID=2650811 RepID=UPI0028496D27|nr:TAXI family TRAP transporter solute-binding subunit [Silvimonas sp.]MDR3427507.1 TAXI family TRAP transporter solute-binding subunit [Silvimonas sp.]